jgi:hypothetical protein
MLAAYLSPKNTLLENIYKKIFLIFTGFPTIQVDMKRPQDFTKSSIFAFSGKWQIKLILFVDNNNNILKSIGNALFVSMPSRFTCLWKQFARVHHEFNATCLDSTCLKSKKLGIF